VKTQPDAGLQVSLVQALPSLQTTTVPPWHVPPLQASPVVQALPSSHAAELFVWAQPVAGLHESSVHGLLSLQLVAGPPWHVPPPQVSPVVHALPSSHGAVLFVATQPLAGSHESSVQGLPSSQTTAVPGWHDPPPQASPVVHALPSSHGLVLLVKTQPDAGLQVSVVQALLSLQTTGTPGRQAPPPQVSPVVQALPSLHGLVLLVKTQPVAGLQVSVVHALLSLQTVAAPG
jgi:hypothetical protein